MQKFSVHLKLEWRTNGEDRMSGGRIEVEAKSAGHAEQVAVARAKEAQALTSLHRCKVTIYSSKPV